MCISWIKLGWWQQFFILEYPRNIIPRSAAKFLRTSFQRIYPVSYEANFLPTCYRQMMQAPVLTFYKLQNIYESRERLFTSARSSFFKVTQLDSKQVCSRLIEPCAVRPLHINLNQIYRVSLFSQEKQHKFFVNIPLYYHCDILHAEAEHYLYVPLASSYPIQSPELQQPYLSFLTTSFKCTTNRHGGALRCRHKWRKCQVSVTDASKFLSVLGKNRSKHWWL